jgi:micrococcal nuclease
MKPIFFAFALTLAVPAFAHKVIGIADGDPLTLLVDRKPLKIRLANIDASQKAQAFGEMSRRSLSALCFGKDTDYQSKTSIGTAAPWQSSHARVSM